MKLTVDQIKDAARGAVRVIEEDGLVRLCRFTAAQEELYGRVSEENYHRTFATAGVVLEFDTDSENLSLDVRCSKGSGRRWFSHSVFVDGKSIGTLGGKHPDGGYADVNGSWVLGPGMKRVKILFPWSACSRIRALELSDGASFAPVKKQGHVLIFGDSITQGYDAAQPENAYASRLAEYLDADCVNKAIGGEVFRPALSELADDMQPDLITVAYGTNDWRRKTPDVIRENARAFFANLRSAYPHTPIVILAPVWREAWLTETPGGDFRGVAELLKGLADELGNALFVDCFGFIPQDLALYSPDGTHPNDEGFKHYADRLIATLQEQGIGPV